MRQYSHKLSGAGFHLPVLPDLKKNGEGEVRSFREHDQYLIFLGKK